MLLKHASYLTIGMLLSLVLPAQAAEQLTLKFGPFEQTVNVGDLDRYAQTGDVPRNLQFVKPFLNDKMRQGLKARLNLSPSMGQKLTDEVLKSPSGVKLLETIKPALPGLTPELLQAGLSLAIRQFNGLDALGIIKAIPQEKITIDVSQAVAIASQMNWSYWRTQAMTTVLQDSLKVDDKIAFKPPFDATTIGPFEVSETTTRLTDPRRQRDLKFDTYLPQSSATATAETRPPLVMIAPGYEADRRFLTYVAKHLASYGFTVVALQHPFVADQGKISLDRLIPPSEFVDRPRDVSFILDELTKDNQAQFSTDRVMVIGHSLGGYTALALAGGELKLDELRAFCNGGSVLERVPADWLQCNATKLPDKTMNLRDKRVQQVVALNPAIGQIFGKSGLGQVDIPTLVLSSSEDSLAPAFSQQFQPFMQLPKEKRYLLTSIGSTHLSVSDPDNFSGAAISGTLVNEKRGAEMLPLRQAVLGVTLAFAQQMTPEAKRYAPFLSSGYVQSLSSSSVKLRFNQELPTNLTKLFQMNAMR
jgi:predicted dienelactone hydrolase